MEEIENKIAIYEKKYGKSYKAFSESVSETPEGHDDWIEWSYFVKIATELSTKDKKIKTHARDD